MSENESFINEVTEEVRRDKLYIFLKKYGWIGGLVVLLIVLSSVIVEVRSAARITEAEKTGDFLADILQKIEEGEDVDFDRSTEFFKDSSLVSLLIETMLAEKRFDQEGTKAAYTAILDNEKIPLSFKDFAKFKLLLLVKDDPLRAEQLLDELITPNNPFRILALEQKVFKNIRENKWQEAQTDLDLLKSDPSSTQALKSRLGQIQKAIIFGEP